MYGTRRGWYAYDTFYQRRNMPRPSLKLPLALSIPTPDNAATTAATPNSKLEADVQQITAQLATEARTTIEPTNGAPSLSDLQNKQAFVTQSHSIANMGNDFFINVSRLGDPQRETFDGHKVHLSVDRDKFEQAYNALAPLLFSNQSPILRFKLTDMERAGAEASGAAGSRVTDGAQFTLY